jgi:hypothetical protein
MEYNVFSLIYSAVTAGSKDYLNQQLAGLLEFRAEFQPKINHFMIRNLLGPQTDESRVRMLFVHRFLDSAGAYGLDVPRIQNIAERIMNGELIAKASDTDGCFLVCCQDIRLPPEVIDSLKEKFFLNW